MRCGNRCLLFFVVLSLLSSIATATPRSEAESLAAWRQQRQAVLNDPTLLRYYDFQDLAPDGKSTTSATVGQEKLTYSPARKTDAAAPEVTQGRWPGKKAVRLDAGSLSGEPFAVPHKAFSVLAWLRPHGFGSLRGNNESTNGTFLSVGSGYWDGWRLTTTYPARSLSFSLGRPKPSNALSIPSEPVPDAVWFHVAATWDGAEMRLYVHGLPSSATAFAGDYTQVAGQRFRIGYAGFGMGSVRFDIDELAIYGRALRADELLRHAHAPARLSDEACLAFAIAAGSWLKRDWTAAAEAYRRLAEDSHLPPAYRACAMLRTAHAHIECKSPAEAAGFLDKLLNDDDAPATLRAAALAQLTPLIEHLPPEAISPAAGRQLLQSGMLTSAQTLDLRMKLARQARQAKQPTAARQQYQQLLKDPEVTAAQRWAIQLELAHTAFELREYQAARLEYGKLVDATDTPGWFKSNALLRIAECLLREQDLTAAQDTLKTLAARTDVPQHHAWEAQQRLQELDRKLAGKPARDPAQGRTAPPAWPKPGREFFVAPNGSDQVSGTRQQPWGTLQHARDAIRALKSAGDLPAGGVTVWVHGGRYALRETLRLEQQDSGLPNAPIVYRAVEGETPIFTGGQTIRGFTPVQDPAILARLPEEARAHVMQTDLRAAGIADLGQFRPAGYGSGAGFTSRVLLQLFCDGKTMPIARWPNEGFVNVGELVGNAPFEERGRSGNRQGRFTYDFDRPQRWTAEKDPWLYGYWFHDWSDSYEKVESIDPTARIITLAPPYHRSGYRKGHRYYALNLLSEIDAPGEWYLDRDTGILYFYPPSDPQRSTIEVSVFAAPMVQMDGVSDVRFRGLVWELGRSDGLHIRGGQRCLLAACTLRKFAGDALTVTGGAQHVILGCDAHHLGRGGIGISGGDRKTLQSGAHVIENCHIHDFSEIDHTYTPAIKVDGVGHRVAHNRLHDSTSSALRVAGNDHLVEFNDVYRVLTESDDQGGVDMWGDPTFRGNVFRWNYWHHIGNGMGVGQAGIRLDDAISGALIYGNLFYRCADGRFGGVQIHGGKDNIVDNNLFVECQYAISFSSWGQKRWLETLARPDFVARIHKAVDISRPPYSTRYPELAELEQNADVNRIWRNIAVGCSQFLARDRGVHQLMDNWTTAADPSIDPQQPGLGLRPDARLLERIGFRPIPVEEIGLYPDPLRASWPP